MASPSGLTLVNPNRRLGNWVEAYQEYTEILPSPPIFRKWVGIFYIAAALERKVWVRTMGSCLYPTLYTILVGPPGSGKGQAIHLGEGILREVPNLCVGPSDMTSASLIDALNEAVRRIILVGDPPYLEFNSLTIIARELGVLIPAWETGLMNNLTDIYDGFVLDQKRRGRDLRIKITDPQINLLGACTPSYLNEVMPVGAWDQGFISRTILVYSGQRVSQDPFREDAMIDLMTRLRADLLHDLKSISMLYGQFRFTTPAASALQAWIKVGCRPEPGHQKLRFYNSRRVAHLLKLCMIASVAVGNTKIIGIEEYRMALEWLLEVESFMPDIFKSMTAGGDSVAMEETWHYVWTLYSKEKRPVAEHRIVHFLRERVPAHSIMKILEVMVRSKMFEIILGKTGFQGYKPTPRTDHGAPQEAPSPDPTEK